jgi:hypothetical protein
MVVGGRGWCRLERFPSSGKTDLLQSLRKVWYECVGIKVDKLWTIDMRKLLAGYVKGCIFTMEDSVRDPQTLISLESSRCQLSPCVISLGCQTKSLVKYIIMCQS